MTAKPTSIETMCAAIAKRRAIVSLTYRATTAERAEVIKAVEEYPDDKAASDGSVGVILACMGAGARDPIATQDVTLTVTTSLSEFYRTHTAPMIERLANHTMRMAGVYSVKGSVRVWRSLVPAIVAAYNAYSYPGKECGELALNGCDMWQIARNFEVNYAGDVKHRAKELADLQALKDRWKLSDIVAASRRSGSPFFDKRDMRRRGETMRNFSVSYELFNDEARVIVTVRDTGRRWLFDTVTHKMVLTLVSCG